VCAFTPTSIIYGYDFASPGQSGQEAGLAVTPGHLCKICIGTLLQRLLLLDQLQEHLAKQKAQEGCFTTQEHDPYNGVRVLVAKVVQPHAGKRIMSACHRRVR